MTKLQPEYKGPVLLCILDGWGEGEAGKGNAIYKAHTPTYDKLCRHYPYSRIITSGRAVGLPDGQMGNSEVGHMIIGAGRVVPQDLPRINDSIATGEIHHNTVIKNLIERTKKNNSVCHVMGLLSDGGVHSSYHHIMAVCKLLAGKGIKVNLHAFLDGRDTAPTSAPVYLENFADEIKNYHNVQIATLTGRYYAMDRDNRWERTKEAFEAIVSARASLSFSNNLTSLVKSYYLKNITDEFIPPIVNSLYEGVKEEDTMIMVNFRGDRVRQILQAFLVKDFNAFVRPTFPIFSYAAAFTHYSDDLSRLMEVVFPPLEINYTLGEILSASGLRQLRVAETEKYAHVTYFFNGGKEDKMQGEERILVPSPKVATYDLKPEMAAAEITDILINALKAKQFDFILVNYANADMVGHTGKIEPTVHAIEVLDKALEGLMKTILEIDGIMLITADHGNAEQMCDDKTAAVHTAHTSNPVPLILCGNNNLVSKIKLKDGGLSDIAPTILDIMKISKPASMTGNSLIIKKLENDKS